MPPTRGRTCSQPGPDMPPTRGRARLRRSAGCAPARFPFPRAPGLRGARLPAKGANALAGEAEPALGRGCAGRGGRSGPALPRPRHAAFPAPRPLPAAFWPPFPSSPPPPARPLAPFSPASAHPGRLGRGRRVVGFVPAEPGVPESGAAGADAGGVQKFGAGRRGRPAAAGPRVSQRGGRGGLLGAGGERGVSFLALASASGCRCCEHVQKYFAIFLFPHQGSGVAGLPVPASKACRSLPCFNRFAAALTARKCCPKSGWRRGGAARAEPGACRGRGGPRRGAGRKSCE